MLPEGILGHLTWEKRVIKLHEVLLWVAWDQLCLPENGPLCPPVLCSKILSYRDIFVLVRLIMNISENLLLIVHCPLSRVYPWDSCCACRSVHLWSTRVVNALRALEWNQWSTNSNHVQQHILLIHTHHFDLTFWYNYKQVFILLQFDKTWNITLFHGHILNQRKAENGFIYHSV